jgi:hypothetical protein
MTIAVLSRSIFTAMPIDYTAHDAINELSRQHAAMHQIEIECAGIRLRVREELDVAHVARLVAALAGVGRAC